MNLSPKNRFATLAMTALLAGAPATSFAVQNVPAANVIPMHPAAVRMGRPVPQRQVRAPLPSAASQQWHAVRPGPHVFYGTIAAIRGAILTLRLRNGRSVPIDASAAIASGNYSVPLFVGKIVSVDGTLVGTTFTATHVFRMSNLANLPVDR
jgi:hypothetical protein